MNVMEFNFSVRYSIKQIFILILFVKIFSKKMDSQIQCILHTYFVLFCYFLYILLHDKV